MNNEIRTFSPYAQRELSIQKALEEFPSIPLVRSAEELCRLRCRGFYWDGTSWTHTHHNGHVSTVKPQVVITTLDYDIRQEKVHCPQPKGDAIAI